jgi:hypothetical protein
MEYTIFTTPNLSAYSVQKLLSVNGGSQGDEDVACGLLGVAIVVINISEKRIVTFTLKMEVIRSSETCEITRSHNQKTTSDILDTVTVDVH